MSVPDDTKRTYMKADDRRAQILGCARQVFAQRGFHVTSVADICAEAGIGRGTLYQYFDNKRDLFLAVLEDIAQRVREVIEGRPAVVEVPGAAEATREVVIAFCERRLRRVLDAVFMDEASLRLLWKEARAVDGGSDRIVRRVDEIVRDAVMRDLAGARDLGVIDCEDVELTALFVIGGVEKMVLDALDRDLPVDLDRIVRIATQIEMFGMLRQPARAPQGRDEE
ncbi:MAG: TetR/AcrR family transcriptional regulator [Myxococcales bacterium]|nr:TetR/AcrR family transcriptional regulator [Myxococcales bacterium]